MYSSLSGGPVDICFCHLFVICFVFVLFVCFYLLSNVILYKIYTNDQKKGI